ncbi:cupin domain-containing protein [Nocardia alba]|uniref:Cupin domain n=1 Tax=Nocardia alba TaxID=225051 RepID=A0A4R1FQ13_9NOCA|nr:cupin domain-containing protein [Nocardia alba]TCJ95672.1 cupin domain [Nocardia alba]
MATEIVTTGSTPDAALLVRYDEAELLEALGVRLYADHEMTGGAMSANRTLLAAGTNGPPPHYHTTSAEMFYMLDGRLRVLAGEEVVTIGEGDFLLIPPNTIHAWAAPAEASADVLIVFTPGIERFEYFRLVERIRQGGATPDEVRATMDRFDNHFVDSPVWQ